MHPELARHLRGVWMPPSHPNHQEMDEAIKREAAEIVARRIIANGRESYAIVGDNIDMRDAVMELLAYRGDEADIIARHVAVIREVALEAAVEAALDRYWSCVHDEYARLIRERGDD